MFSPIDSWDSEEYKYRESWLEKNSVVVGILRVVQTQAIYFLNQCRKQTDSTYNDSEMMNFLID